MIESVLAWGADFIIWLQQFNGWAWDGLMRFVSWLGGMGYLFSVPLVLWCVDRRLGVQMLMLLALTLYLNTVIKEWFELARPFQSDPRILSEGEVGYSFPSGHAQLVAVFWGLAAHWMGRRWFSALCLAVVLLTGLSRSYLGVHYPSDVVVGWLLGGLTLWLWLRFGRLIPRGSNRQAAIWLVMVTGGLTLLAIALNSSAMVYGSLGAFLAAGLSAGVVSDAPGQRSYLRRAARYPLGLVLMFALLALLPKVADWSPLSAGVDAFVLMVVFAGVVTALLPALFQKVRL